MQPGKKITEEGIQLSELTLCHSREMQEATVEDSLALVGSKRKVITHFFCLFSQHFTKLRF